MSISHYIQTLGKELTGNPLKEVTKGRWSLIFDEQWLMHLFERHGFLYLEVALETDTAALPRKYFRLEGEEIRIIQRNQEYWLQSRCEQVSINLPLIKQHINRMLEICGDLQKNDPVRPSQPAISPMSLSTGVIRP